MSLAPQEARLSANDGPDVDRYRLRRFVEMLDSLGELQTVEDPVDLADIASRLDGNPKAVLFRSAGTDRTELVGNVVGSRRRLALAFGVDPEDLRAETQRRLAHPIAPVEVSKSNAPVQQVVLQGNDADLTKLPVHCQHGLDGGVYISAGIDVSRSSDGRKRNIGYRRLMLRGRNHAGIDLLAPSDLRAAYLRVVEEGKTMPIAFIVGSHPLDSIAAISMTPVDDEVSLMGALRQSAVPLVKCVSNDLMVPADAEYIIEGYLDEKGWREPEGPYGEYLGYYGAMKMNPVFHVTAITHRRDALFQTATIGGRFLGQTDTAPMTALRTEVAVWGALESAIREPVAVYCPAASGGMFNVRLSMRSRYPGEARNAIAAVFGSSADVKHVFVVDDDIDIFSDEQMEWALATRFQADRDLVVSSGFRTMPLDPSLHGARSGSKCGFDLTFPFGWQKNQEFRIPAPPVVEAAKRGTVREALDDGPKYFVELMSATGSRDGRDTTIEIDKLRDKGILDRDENGRYKLKVGS
ncbi:UbiD family decarboxylase [Bradyrhizobium sp. 14AA]